VAWGSPFPLYPWWIGSVAEAVFLIGEERNSPKIIGASYVRAEFYLARFSKFDIELTSIQAPMFRNIKNWQWSPTLIAFDADSSHTSRSTSWHVIKVNFFPNRNLQGLVICELTSEASVDKQNHAKFTNDLE
jgi:alpha-N-arabinofuranosidase